MLFNSWTFLLLFLPGTFCFYWFVVGHSRKLQNIFLLSASYFFYGYWDYRFLGLLFISSFSDYVIAQFIEQSESQHKARILVFLSLCLNLGILGFFKYFNFFADTLETTLGQFGIGIDKLTLDIILPVGISFYTFQTIGYIIDVYKRKVRASRDPVAFFTFVGFFPQLVAGPIERAGNLLPQFQERRLLDYESGRHGCQLILWGLFIKVVVADSCGQEVDAVFADIGANGSALMALAQCYFVVQLYGDFAGYSYIAVGTAKLFGFTLSQNFNYPLFSRSIPEFWTRWHITLTNWFGDYLFRPLAKKAVPNKFLIALTYVFMLSSIGLWHGPRFTYLVSIGSTALYFLPRIFLDRKKGSRGRAELADIPIIIITFLLISFHLVFFRSENMSDAIAFITHLFVNPVGTVPVESLLPLLSVALMFLVEWHKRTEKFPTWDRNGPVLVRWPLYVFLCIAVINLLHTPRVYIYFQF